MHPLLWGIIVKRRSFANLLPLQAWASHRRIVTGNQGRGERKIMKPILFVLIRAWRYELITGLQVVVEIELLGTHLDS